MRMTSDAVPLHRHLSCRGSISRLDEDDSRPCGRVAERPDNQLKVQTDREDRRARDEAGPKGEGMRARSYGSSTRRRGRDPDRGPVHPRHGVSPERPAPWTCRMYTIAAYGKRVTSVSTLRVEAQTGGKPFSEHPLLLGAFESRSWIMKDLQKASTSLDALQPRPERVPC